MRLQIPAYTDHWMRGDRFGELVKVTSARRIKARESVLTDRRWANCWRIAHVKLDKSGKTIRVILDDCQEV